MSVKLKFKCVCFKEKHCFALVVLNRFLVCFYQGLFTRCDFCHTILLYYYAETKEMIYKSLNLKGVVYEQNSFSFQSITTRTGFTNGSIFYFLFSEDFLNDLIDSNAVMQSTWQTGVANAGLEFCGEARFQIFHENSCYETLNISSVSNRS